MESTNRIIQRDTGAWRMQVWISFGIAVLVCGTGLAWLPGDDLDRAFMVMGYFFCLSAAFVLSKYVRDKAIADTDTPMWGMVAVSYTHLDVYKRQHPSSFPATTPVLSRIREGYY